MNLSPVLRQRFFDANGLPLAGGQLFSYIAGTTTPQGTFSNQSGTTNTNPVILDSQGYADVWIDLTKAYKFVLEDANNNVLWTVDSVNAAAGINTSQSYDLTNLTLATSVVSNALTVAVKTQAGTDPSGTNPITVGMRSSTLSSGLYLTRSITSGLSQTLSSGTTLGMLASQNNSLWAYLVDSDGSGTMKLALSSIKWDDRSVQSVVAESFTVTISNSTPGIVSATGHGLNNNDAIRFTTTGALPTGLSTGTTYYVVASATNTFEVASSPGGSAINTSSAGSGVHTAHIAGWRLVSGAAYSSVPIRLIGRMIVNLSVSGTWLAPSEIDLAPLPLPETIQAQYGGGGGTTGGASNGIIKIIGFKFDTHGIYNSSTGQFLVPTSGYWELSYWINASTQAGIQIYVNGSGSTSMGILLGNTGAGQGGGSGVVKVSALDLIDFRPAGTDISGGWGGGSYVTLKKVGNSL